MGFMALMGLRITGRGDGLSKAQVIATSDHMNPQGICHGGVVYSMADTGMGAALTSVLAEGERCTTIEIKMVYIAAAREGEILCESRVIHKGRTTAVLESEVYQAGRHIAKALGTFAILQPRSV